MGSGDWFKNIISLKKVKCDKSKKPKGSSAPEVLNGIQLEPNSQKESSKFGNGTSNGNNEVLGLPVDMAATRIQTAFRAFMAQKKVRNLKGMVRLQRLNQVHSVRKQASTTLNYLHSWSRIQSVIRDRRICMVTQGRIRQKKLENQLKHEAKLHDLEVEWSGGSETMEEVLARIHMREEAAVKRERAMAYAFSHQWRANSSSNFGAGTYELGKDNWGWSWTERWIAARPWEGRARVKTSPKKVESMQASKTGKNIKSPPSVKTSPPSVKTPASIKSISPNGKGISKGRKLSYGAAEKVNAKREPMVS